MNINLQNHFLIAMPGLEDPFFKRSVIYICEHNIDGAMGLIINKPIQNLKIKNILKKLKINTVKPQSSIIFNSPVFLGGPLAEDRGFILHSSQSVNTFASSVRVSQNTIITTSRDILETIGEPNQPINILVALGYSAWSKNQLENEILDNSWLTIPADNNILFNTPIKNRWEEAAKNIGINISQIANHAGHA